MTETAPTMRTLGVCVKCGTYGKNIALHMCCACYQQDLHSRRIGTCVDCGHTKPIKARNMCGACYGRSTRHTIIGTCAECGRQMRIKARSLCQTCYQKTLMDYGRCVLCGHYALIDHSRRCVSCLNRIQYLRRKRERLAA